MGYQGDAQRAAPTLIEVAPELDEAESLFREALRNIELMLRLDVIHGDIRNDPPTHIGMTFFG